MTLLFGLLLFACQRKEENILTIKTSEGSIKVKLYNETPLHRDNFIKLAKEGFYDGILFHRVIKDFVIQAGDPESKGAKAGILLGAKSVKHDVKAEIRPEFFHKRGVLAAAREGDNINPEKVSSGSHFYIVTGQTYTNASLDSLVGNINNLRLVAMFNRVKAKYDTQINSLSARNDFDGLEEIHKKISLESRELLEQEKVVLTDEQRRAYTGIGGAPRLDGKYTIFGEVIEGMDVVDTISALATDENDRPVKDVVIIEIQ